MIVVDASVIVAFITDHEYREKAREAAKEAWGNAAIPGFGIGRPVRTPTLDPAALSAPLASAGEAARAERTFDITPASLIVASGPEMRLLVTLGLPAVAAQRADDRFIAGLLGAAWSS